MITEADYYGCELVSEGRSATTEHRFSYGLSTGITAFRPDHALKQIVFDGFAEATGHLTDQSVIYNLVEKGAMPPPLMLDYPFKVGTV